MANVIVKVDFKKGGDAPYSGYISYMDREEVEVNSHNNVNHYTGYIDYMNRDEAKGSGLFTGSKHRLDDEDIENLKSIFDSAQENGGFLWRITISFRTGFLEQIGLKRKDFFDEDLIKDVTKKSMEAAIKKTALYDPIWVAEIHHNTENPHIHIAMTETSLFKKDGFLKGVHKIVKSTIVNELMYYDRPEIKQRQEKINNMIRSEIIPRRKEKFGLTFDKKKNRELYIQIFKKLPQDRRLWYYNMSAMKDIRPYIDAYTKRYLSEYHKEAIEDLKEALEEQVSDQEIYYGHGEVEPNQYAENKLEDLYVRLGNVLLSEMKRLDIQLFTSPGEELDFNNDSKRGSNLQDLQMLYLKMDIETKSYLYKRNAMINQRLIDKRK